MDSQAVNVRFLAESLGKLDEWRRNQPDIPNRPEAIRRLVELSLDAAEKKR